ncbi:MAG: glycosyltransferase [Deltaproteobacteria bacterium]|nr:glycosyltransferase [Deltaproteobacteria bacterium]
MAVPDPWSRNWARPRGRPEKNAACFPTGFSSSASWPASKRKKGAADLLQAVGRLASERVGVVVVGDGPEREALEQRARELGIGERVRFTGTVAHEDVAPYMRGFDAFVLPSRDVPGWREQFGKVLVEAMVCGTPVVGSDAGAIPDVVGDAGLIFPQGDVERLAAMLTELLENSALRQRLSEAGPRRAAERFTDEAAARPLVATWRELTGRP